MSNYDFGVSCCEADASLSDVHTDPDHESGVVYDKAGGSAPEDLTQRDWGSLIAFRTRRRRALEIQSYLRQRAFGLDGKTERAQNKPSRILILRSAVKHKTMGSSKGVAVCDPTAAVILPEI